MTIQKQVIKESTTTHDTEGLGVSLNTLRKSSDRVAQSQKERNSHEINAYSHDIRKSLLVGGAVVLGELLFYFLHIVK